MLRKFSPALLDALELTQDIEGEQSACLRALQMLKELNASGRRKLPEDAPTDFLSQRLKPIVINHGEIDRRAWECALLLKPPLHAGEKAGPRQATGSAFRCRARSSSYSTRFNDFALEFYTFVADNYAPFYSLPIKCTDRDAAFVLDGLLYNESELEIEEHYTDTHGYMEINFAAITGIARSRRCRRNRSQWSEPR
jgi:Tn3 transposase DDE domain